LDYIGHPVIGDPLYGKGNRKLYDKGQLLHAYRLTFVHPRTGKEVSFEAPLPDYFADLLKKLS
jgi:23S rRNA pseudouridine1911/1915/1917 synthase